jgi:hypothetical protein
MKNSLREPSLDFVVIFDVEAEEHPPPPADDTVVVAGLSFKRSITAWSSFMAAPERCLAIFESIHKSTALQVEN